MSASDSASPIVRGIGTATTDHLMSQDDAVRLAQTICCQTDEQRSLVRVLFRRSGVKSRSTAVPYTRAFDFLDIPHDEAAAGGSAKLALGADAALTGSPVDAPASTRADAPAATLAPSIAPTISRGPTTGERMLWYRAAAGPLAIDAAAKALAAAGVDPASITHLVTVTCTGFFAPGIDTALILGLGLRPTTERVQVGFMGCHGGINGLRAADAIVRARPASRVLLCAVELCSVHFCFEWDPARLVGNAVFGDGAAALVITSDAAGDRAAVSDASIDAQHAMNHVNGAAQRQTNGAANGAAIGAGNANGIDNCGAGPAWRLAGSGSCLLPDSTAEMTWEIGDHGFEMYLSSAVPHVIGRGLEAWIEGWLAGFGLKVADIGSWAVHPGGPRILTAVEEALHLPRSATSFSRGVLADHGNMSSPTVFFIIQRMQAAGAPLPCVALGFGPGLTAEAALFI